MLTSADVRNKEFAKSTMGGYKPADVDYFLEEVATALDLNQKENADLVKKLEVLAAKVEEYHKDEDSIHTALLNAQRLADQVLRDANKTVDEHIAASDKQSADIIAAANYKADVTLSDAEAKAAYITKTSRERAESLLADANKKAEAMIAAANDSVLRQHELFQRIKGEVSTFRAGLLAQYKMHVEMVNSLPDEVKNPPSYSAELAAGALGGSHPMNNDFDMEAGFVEPKHAPPPELLAAEEEPEPVAAPKPVAAIPAPQPVPAQAPVPAVVAPRKPATPPAAEAPVPAVPAAPKPVASFKVLTEDEDEETPEKIPHFGKLKFGEDYASDYDSDTDDSARGDEKAGYGFFKRRNK